MSDVVISFVVRMACISLAGIVGYLIYSFFDLSTLPGGSGVFYSGAVSAAFILLLVDFFGNDDGDENEDDSPPKCGQEG